MDLSVWSYMYMVEYTTLWIWQLSHLGESEARLYILGSKARHVVSHFLLVLPVIGFAPKSSTAIHHRRKGWDSSCSTVC